MAMTRRKFLGVTSATVAAAYLPWRFGARAAYAFAQSPTTVPLFGTPLRGAGPGGIPVAAPDGSPAPVTGVQHYTINVNQYQDAGVAPTLGPTTLRGYHPLHQLGGPQPQAHLGGIIVAQRGVPIQLTFRNNLPGGLHIIPNDLTLPGANLGNNRVAVHIHGGLVPWISDGGPFDWWDPTGVHGPSFLNNQVLNPEAAANEAEYYYPMNQSARFMWYHDHAWGITRINAYAGIASGLIIRDAFEADLLDQGLPNYVEAGGKEIPLVIQDKIFVGPSTTLADPTWQSVVDGKAWTPGSLWYAHVYEKNRWKLNGKGVNPGDPSVIPEFFGDTMLVNGTAFPRAPVEPCRYRLRLLNACNARFLNLQLYVADGSEDGITLSPAGVPTNLPALCDPTNPGEAANVLQIGTEGGFLPRPALIPTNVPINPAVVPARGSLVVAPAERPDVLIDFSAHEGQSIILYNDAPAPFPVGDPRNDYFPLFNVKQNPTNALTPRGFGPNSRVLMRFDVGTTITSSPDASLAIDATTSLTAGIDAPLVAFGTTAPPANIPVRQLSLNEGFDAFGRLMQLLGTLTPLPGAGPFLGRPYDSAPTEMPVAGTTEVWEVYNKTADVHPMHFHLVNVQVLNRQVFKNVNGVPTLGGPLIPPPANETGWKETVPMYPGTVTRILMRFDLPVVPFTVPSSPRTGGHEYVWHCHILEHEEHDMMRPLVVI